MLPGPIPPELGDLAALQHLDLSCNKLSGESVGEFVDHFPRCSCSMDVGGISCKSGEKILTYAPLKLCLLLRYQAPSRRVWEISPHYSTSTFNGTSLVVSQSMQLLIIFPMQRQDAFWRDRSCRGGERVFPSSRSPQMSCLLVFANPIPPRCVELAALQNFATEGNGAHIPGSVVPYACRSYLVIQLRDEPRQRRQIACHFQCPFSYRT